MWIVIWLDVSNFFWSRVWKCGQFWQLCFEPGVMNIYRHDRRTPFPAVGRVVPGLALAMVFPLHFFSAGLFALLSLLSFLVPSYDSSFNSCTSWTGVINVKELRMRCVLWDKSCDFRSCSYSSRSHHKEHKAGSKTCICLWKKINVHWISKG